MRTRPESYDKLLTQQRELDTEDLPVKQPVFDASQSLFEEKEEVQR